uniref:Uncharacterized protein n=1 Tax=Arundo donax TaxID=35708 RepID=A0A0A9DX27_ARUDO
MPKQKIQIREVEGSRIQEQQQQQQPAEDARMNKPTGRNKSMKFFLHHNYTPKNANPSNAPILTTPGHSPLQGPDRLRAAPSRGRAGRGGPLAGDQVLVAPDRGRVGRWGLGILEALLVVDLPQPLDLLL